jgi:hypothetical protein
MAVSDDIRAQRGTKRTCQNPECESRFYDLNRDPITCPVCGTVYSLARAVPVAAPPVQKPQRPTKQPVVEGPKPEDTPEAEGEELVALEGEEETVVADDEDETFIEEVEEDSPDVKGIIDAPIEDTDEKP